MALADCRECGKAVPTEAVSCPHCGTPQPARGASGPSEGRPTPSGGSPFRKPHPQPSRTEAGPQRLSGRSAQTPSPAVREARSDPQAGLRLLWGVLGLLVLLLLAGVAGGRSLVLALIALLSL